MCFHESCKVNERVWLTEKINEESDIAPHPWCIHCGLVKNITDDRPHNKSYWISILTQISKKYSIKQVQKRMISKNIISHNCFNDLYGITGSSQKKFFIKLVKQYCNIDSQSIESFIH